MTDDVTRDARDARERLDLELADAMEAVGRRLADLRKLIAHGRAWSHETVRTARSRYLAAVNDLAVLEVLTAPAQRPSTEPTPLDAPLPPLTTRGGP